MKNAPVVRGDGGAQDGLFALMNLPPADGEERLRRGEECPLGIVKKSWRSREERTCGAW